MKKCPKCGTILDDSKKKCYMCGADLQRRMGINFGENFDNAIGATVTTSQDNVFNNVNNISANVNDVVSNDNNSNMTFSGSSSNDLYKNQLDSLNSIQFDNRTGLEKIFSGDSRFNNKEQSVTDKKKGKNKRNSLDAEINNASKNVSTNTNVNNTNNVVNDIPPSNPINNVVPNNIDSNPMNNSSVTNDLFGSRKEDKPEIMPQPVAVVPPVVPPVNNEFSSPKEVEKPLINWGNNLVGDKNNVSGYKDKVSKKSGLNINTVFNLLCVVIFIGGMYFVFNYFNKKDESPKEVNLGGLIYTIDEDFVLKSDDVASKYYVYGDSCAVRVSYQTGAGQDDFIDSYFASIKETYSKMENIQTVEELLKINNNEWSSLNIGELQNNPSGGGGRLVIKYKDVGIVHKNNFYSIKYTNSMDSAECSAKFNAFMDTLNFDS